MEPFISSTPHLCIFDLKSYNGCSLLHKFKFTVINLQDEDKYLCRYRYTRQFTQDAFNFNAVTGINIHI